MVGQYTFFDKKNSYIVSLVASLISAIVLYNRIKTMNKGHLEYLKFHNLLLTTIFAILLPMLGIYVHLVPVLISRGHHLQRCPKPFLPPAPNPFQKSVQNPACLSF